MIKKNIIFKLLGEETKFRILNVLMNGERCACEIPRLINRTQSNTSMHLAKLLKNNIIQSRKDGKKIIYKIKEKKIKDLLKIVK